MSCPRLLTRSQTHRRSPSARLFEAIQLQRSGHCLSYKSKLRLTASIHHDARRSKQAVRQRQRTSQAYDERFGSIGTQWHNCDPQCMDFHYSNGRTQKWSVGCQKPQPSSWAQICDEECSSRTIRCCRAYEQPQSQRLDQDRLAYDWRLQPISRTYSVRNDYQVAPNSCAK